MLRLDLPSTSSANAQVVSGHEGGFSTVGWNNDGTPTEDAFNCELSGDSPFTINIAGAPAHEHDPVDDIVETRFVCMSCFMRIWRRVKARTEPKIHSSQNRSIRSVDLENLMVQPAVNGGCEQARSSYTRATTRKMQDILTTLDGESAYFVWLYEAYNLYLGECQIENIAPKNRASLRLSIVSMPSVVAHYCGSNQKGTLFCTSSCIHILLQEAHKRFKSPSSYLSHEGRNNALKKLVVHCMSPAVNERVRSGNYSLLEYTVDANNAHRFLLRSELLDVES